MIRFNTNSCNTKDIPKNPTDETIRTYWMTDWSSYQLMCISGIYSLSGVVNQGNLKSQLRSVCSDGGRVCEKVESESGVESAENNPLPM